MFEILAEPRSRRRSLLSSRTLSFSVGAHALLVLAAAAAPPQRTKAATLARTEVVTFVDLATELEAPAPLPASARGLDGAPAREHVEAAPETVREAPAARGFQELVAPDEIPSALPDLDPTLRAVNAADFSGFGAAGGMALGIMGGRPGDRSRHPAAATDFGGDVLDLDLLDQRPRLMNRMEVERLLRLRYPRRLERKGITGTVVLRFVIGPDGRVEPSTISVLAASNDDFGAASLQVVKRFRFRPAKVGGRAVRVAASLPVYWRLENS